MTQDTKAPERPKGDFFVVPFGDDVGPPMLAEHLGDNKWAVTGSDEEFDGDDLGLAVYWNHGPVTLDLLTAAEARAEAAEAERDRLAALLGEAKEALRWYHDQMCEGFCEDLRYDNTYCPEMDDECAGCKARATLAKMEEEIGK